MKDICFFMGISCLINQCIFACFLPTSLAPIGRARNALPSGNGAGRDPRNPAKRDMHGSLAGSEGPDTVLPTSTLQIRKIQKTKA